MVESMPEKGDDNTPVSSRRFFLRGCALGVGLGTVGVGGGLLTAGYLGAFDGQIRRAMGVDNPIRPLQWSHVAAKGTIDWPETFAKDETLSLTDKYVPAQWKKLGILVTDAEALEAQRLSIDGQHAVAQRLSDTQVNMGIMPDGHPFLSSRRGDPGQHAVALRVGPGDLQATIGLYQPDEGLFVPASAGVLALRTIQLENLKHELPGVIVL